MYDGVAVRPILRSIILAAAAASFSAACLATASPQPAAPAAAESVRVRLATTKGDIVIEVHPAWAPRGAGRFLELVKAGYYDDMAFSRVIAGKWAQFGINGQPKVATAWRTRAIPDDPFQQSNVRATVAFAYAVANGRTTQVFINLGDNRPTHDKEPFVPFGRVIGVGMTVADTLFSEYGEAAGSGIRSGQQGPLFEGGNVYLRQNFPKLDYIVRATVLP